MTYSLACPVCDERLYGTSWADTDPQVLLHMNVAHPAPKKRVPKTAARQEVLPELDIEGLEEPW